MNDFSIKKIALRQTMLTKRRNFAKQRTKIEKIRYQLAAKNLFIQNLPLFQNYCTEIPFGGTFIAAYQPYQSEFDPSYLIKFCQDQGAKICFPKILSEQDMVFYQDSLIKKEEQDSSNQKEIWPNFFLIPLVAFDRKGYRLGFGKGYFDRYLNRISAQNNIFTLGIAYEFQKTETIYPQNHDQKLNAVLTEKKLHIFS